MNKVTIAATATIALLVAGLSINVIAGSKDKTAMEEAQKTTAGPETTLSAEPMGADKMLPEKMNPEEIGSDTMDPEYKDGMKEEPKIDDEMIGEQPGDMLKQPEDINAEEVKPEEMKPEGSL